MSYSVVFTLDMGDMKPIDAVAYGTVVEGDTFADSGKITVTITSIIAPMPQPNGRTADVNILPFVQRWCISHLEEMIERQYLNALVSVDRWNDWDRTDIQ